MTNTISEITTNLTVNPDFVAEILQASDAFYSRSWGHLIDTLNIWLIILTVVFGLVFIIIPYLLHKTQKTELNNQFNTLKNELLHELSNAKSDNEKKLMEQLEKERNEILEDMKKFQMETLNRIEQTELKFQADLCYHTMVLVADSKDFGNAFVLASRSIIFSSKLDKANHYYVVKIVERLSSEILPNINNKIIMCMPSDEDGISDFDQRYKDLIKALKKLDIDGRYTSNITNLRVKWDQAKAR